jgi:hypothetical protein
VTFFFPCSTDSEGKRGRLWSHAHIGKEGRGKMAGAWVSVQISPQMERSFPSGQSLGLHFKLPRNTSATVRINFSHGQICHH